MSPPRASSKPSSKPPERPQNPEPGPDDDAAGPFAGRATDDPARLAYRAAQRRGFPFLRLRRGRSFGPGEGAWWRDIGRAEGEHDTEALFRVGRHFDLGDEDGPALSGLAPERPVSATGREETDR
jgi:hypothetical protein